MHKPHPLLFNREYGLKNTLINTIGCLARRFLCATTTVGVFVQLVSLCCSFYARQSYRFDVISAVDARIDNALFIFIWDAVARHGRVNKRQLCFKVMQWYNSTCWRSWTLIKLTLEVVHAVNMTSQKRSCSRSRIVSHKFYELSCCLQMRICECR